MIKHITTLTLAVILAAGSVSANTTKLERLYKKPTAEQTERYTQLAQAFGNLLHDAVLFPAHKVKITKAEAVTAKAFLTILLDFLQYFEKNEDSFDDTISQEKFRTWALDHFNPLIDLMDEKGEIFERESTVIKLLAACMDSLNDPVYRQTLARNFRALHKGLLAVSELDLKTFAEAVGVNAEVASKTIIQLKAIEPEVERLTRLGCDVGHNEAVKFYNQMIKQDKLRGLNRRSAIKYSSKLMEGYAIARKFFNHAIKPWGGADLSTLLADFETFKAERGTQELSQEDKQRALKTMRKALNYFSSMCKELIAICDKAIAKK